MLSQKTLLGCLLGLIFLSIPRLGISPARPGDAGYVLPGDLPGATTLPATTPFPSATPALLEKVHGQPPLSLTLMLGFTICTLGLVVGVIVLGMIAGVRRPKDTTGPQAAADHKATPSKTAGERKTKKGTARGKRR